MPPVDGETAGIFTAVGGAVGLLAKTIMERRSADDKRLDEREAKIWDRVQAAQALELKVRDDEIVRQKAVIDEQGRQIEELTRQVRELQRRLRTP